MPVLLIAVNFVREQRWPLITLLLYVMVFGGGIALFGGQSDDDTLFMLRSTSMYGLAFTGLLSASALNNERRTRRILAVLSKGVSRNEYLAGLLIGAMIASAVYCMTIFAVGALATHRFSLLVPFAVMLMTLFLLAASVALVFSTVFHPLLASAAAGLLLGAEGLLARALGRIWLEILPSYMLVDRAVNFGESGWHAPWLACLSAVIQAGVFWMVASAIFARRDIAVAVE
jgi:ABC-type transport system involved in multi-copper enzyme maturation permease subunit